MRLLMIGSLSGPLATAGALASRRGAQVTHSETLAAALDALRVGHGAELILCDVGLDIGSLVKSLKSERINVPVVACGIGADSAAAVRAIRGGAREYLPLPPDPELIAAVLEAVAHEDKTFIARDPSMKPVLTLVERVAPSDASVLITGESGTGKEVVARFIHRKSRRSGARFVSVNCAAIPDHLLESELFGHEKGAFTGAVARRIGKFEEANGGTLLLDEISEMDLRLQAKLLRVVQEREVDRVGGTAPVRVDIRLIATSNRDMAAEVDAGRFREDLYYRLNVVNLALPPLRERPADIAPLAEHFIRKYAEVNAIPVRALSPEALDRLRTCTWRGNVRELENALHRAVLLAQGPAIEVEDIVLQSGALSRDGGSPISGAAAVVAVNTDLSAGSSASVLGAVGGGGSLVGRKVADVERDLILDTLHHCLGNRTHAATILGISIRTLRNKLKLYSDLGSPVPPASGAEGEHAAP